LNLLGSRESKIGSSMRQMASSLTQNSSREILNSSSEKFFSRIEPVEIYVILRNSCVRRNWN
jgi:hypothetical protein